MEPISSELIHEIRAQYTLPWRGTHGVTHWARVRETGLHLAARTGAYPAVVELFAVLCDARRRNEGSTLATEGGARPSRPPSGAR